MAYFKRTTIFQSIFFSRGMALALLFMIFFVGYGVFSVAGKSIEASKARKMAESQASDLTQKQSELSKKLANLDTASGQEAALREQFPVVKPGEHVVVITDSTSAAATVQAARADGAAPASSGFWSFLKHLFKKN